MNVQGMVVVLVVGIIWFTPLWTAIAVWRRYGVLMLERPWWWLWIRIGCNGIMAAGMAMAIFGVWAQTQSIKNPIWGGILSWVLIGAISLIGGIILLRRKVATETLYKESFPLAFLWFTAIVMVLAMRLGNFVLSVHVLNGLLLTGFGAVFTRFLKRWF